MVYNTTHHPTHTHTVYLYLEGVGLETMQLDTFRSKFQYTIMNGLVSSFLYGLYTLPDD